jgi:hypothetical protein
MKASGLSAIWMGLAASAVGIQFPALYPPLWLSADVMARCPRTPAVAWWSPELRTARSSQWPWPGFSKSDVFLASPAATPEEENGGSKFGHGVDADARGSDCCAPSQIFEDNPL